MVMFDSTQTECAVPLWSPNATKLPMSADTGHTALFCLPDSFSCKSPAVCRYRGATEQKDVWHMHPMDAGARVRFKAAFVGGGSRVRWFKPTCFIARLHVFLLKPAEV